MKLVIVESPSKCKKIEKYLGSDYKCIASIGHITEVDTTKGIKCLKNDYTPIYKIKNGKQLTKIKKTVSKSEQVFIGTDDDREGEMIGWTICYLLKLPIDKTPRIIFREVSKQALQYAIKHPINIRMNKVYSQQARQSLDILIGFKLSPILWKYTKNCTSIGRCQTPAVRLVYDREKMIKEQPPNEQLITYAVFNNTKFKLNKIFNDKSEVYNFLEHSKTFTYNYMSSPYEVMRVQPPKPLTTSLLQQLSSQRLRLSPKETMKQAQWLYENGWITYMRTDTSSYSLEFMNKVQSYMREEYSEDYFNTQCFYKYKQKDNQNHESIRPIYINDKPEKYVNLYNLIWKISIQSCLSYAEFLIYNVCITAPFDTKYEKQFQQLVFEGWKIIDDEYADDNISEEFYRWCPYEPTKKDEKKLFGGLNIPKPESLIKPYKNPLKYEKITTNTELKQTNYHYNEASLISALEKKGIGRPSTFSNIISTIQNRKYVCIKNIDGYNVKVHTYILKNDIIEEITKNKMLGKENNKLVITPLGKELIEFVLNNVSDLFDYSYTSKMETELDRIEEGSIQRKHLCKNTDDNINEIISHIKDNNNVLKRVINKWVINKNMELIRGRYGVYLKYNNKNINLKEWYKNILLNGFNKDEKEVIKDIWNYGDLNKLKNYIGEKSFKNVIDEQKNDNRFVTENLSVRKSKYGYYLYYKTPSMKRPQFISLKKFNEDPMTCNIDHIKTFVDSQTI